ncbi:helix-turn-helix domain-containing protein [uncultured Thomasclavelia sp.]|uniref:helix-turn-helix domain-containing protein n=1 Tax=uncultured Thomasclavelia sp. TaxID=3025759 RepID=UPI0025EAD39C|nr:helix-turn-helix transcriptional regulator [uncultured Thomasclavelia sp.]
MNPSIDPIKTGLKIKTLMIQNGITARDIQEELSLGCVQSVYRWLNGKSLPSVDNLYALSYIFNVTVDELICGNREQFKKPYIVKEIIFSYQLYN